jgi:ribonuclease III
MEEALLKLAAALGYQFNDVALLRAALTHRSYASEHGTPPGTPPGFGADNERLEFLGDAVLGLVIAEALWARVPGAREGELSRLRAAVVNEAALAEVAARAHVGEGMRLGRGEDRMGGRGRPSILADALEAVFAAVYLDGGFDAAKDVITRALARRIDEVVTRGVHDDKSMLQELLQARHRITPRYEVVATYGPDHDREHEVELRAGDVVTARGRGRSKKEAEQAAAHVALEALEARGSAEAAPRPTPATMEPANKAPGEGR